MTTPNDDLDPERLSAVAFDAIVQAFRYVREQMPNASDSRIMLIILSGIARNTGIAGIERDDVMSIVSSAYQTGLEIRQRLGSPR